ncbi:MAG TPA: 50S ribosomal protein L21 [Xanthobacteraceae bacterium]|jgi:large subunit ribosomal protein L21|nr:50S ribosomal protein L21 [Xanthobacteraceae bacterium]
MFAVIRTGGKQYRVAEDNVLRVDKIDGKQGEIIQFGEVLVLGGDTPTIGAPISGASVAAEVIDQFRGAKIISFKKRRRKNSRRKRGHRQEYTMVRITEILTDGAKPTKTARPKPEPKPKVAKDQDHDADDAGESTTAKKPSAKKTAAKKPAAKKAAAKPAAKKAAAKTATKKPATKKPAAGKSKQK